MFYMPISEDLYAIGTPKEKQYDYVNIDPEKVKDTTKKMIMEFANNNTDTSKSDINVMIGQIITTALSFVGVIFLILMIYGGFLWMTAAGNDEKISKAKNIFRDGIIGIIVVLAAGAIYITVRELLLSGTIAGTGQSQ